MPTSSQALILQFAGGQLPNEPLPPITVNRRQAWRYDFEEPRVWQQPDFAGLMEALQNPTPYYLPTKKTFEKKRPEKKQKPKLLSVQHYGNKPVLEYKVDFTTLPEALRVRGLHGSFYNPSENTVSWQVNTIGPFYERQHKNSPKLTHERGTTYVGGDRSTETLLYKEFASPARLAYTHGNKEPSHGETSRSTPHTTAVTKYMKYETVDGETRLIETNTGPPDYFRLVFNGVDASTGQATYRLQKCTHGENGSFCLKPTDGIGAVGDFKLIPPSGFVADDFRIVKSSADSNCYVIIKEDDRQPGQYYYVQKHRDEGTMFNLPMRNTSQLPPSVPKRAWEEVPYQKSNTFSTDYFNVNSRWEKEEQNMQFGLRRNTPCNSTDQLYTQSHDVRQSDSENVDISHRLPYLNNDILRKSESGYNGSTIGPEFESKESGFHRASPIGRYGAPSPATQHRPEAFAQYPTKHQSIDTSSETYKRLMGLGFRKVRDPNDVNDAKSLNSAIKKNASIANKGLPSSEWKTHNFDQWSRTTDFNDVGRAETSYRQGDNITYLKRNSILGKTGASATTDNVSLLDEVKLKADYKEWKKKKITAVRMRKELPPTDDTAVCIRLSDNAIPHDRLLKSIERENDVKLRSLQFDPISVHSTDSDAKSQWILRFESKGVCDGLIITGLKIDDVKYTVRRFNDVMREEHDAYKFYEIIKEMNKRKQQKVKKSRNTETQTSALMDNKAK